MKKLILIAFALTLSFKAHAEKDRGGGDQYSIAFIKTANEVLRWAKSSVMPLPVSAAQLQKAINETTVESTTAKLIVDEVEKDAVNFPKLKKIQLSRQAWDRKATKAERLVMVYHEYLGILGVDDSRYVYSTVIDSTKSYLANCQAFPKTRQLSCQAEQVAKIFARGIYAQMDREALAKNPQVKIDYDLQESHASLPGNEIYRALRSTDDGVYCGAIVYIDHGVPTLETDIDCSK